MALPTGKQETDFKALEEANYQVRLKGITLQIETEYQSEAFNDGDGLAYQGCTLIWDVDGEEYWDKFVRVSMHERSKLFNRISALIGRDFTETDKLEWKVNPKAEKNFALDQYYKASKDDRSAGIKKGQYVMTADEPIYEGIEGVVDDLLVNGESIIGAECLLHITVNKKGYNRADETAASPLPKRGGRRSTAPVSEPEDTSDDEEEAVEEPKGRRRKTAAAEDDADEAPAPAKGRRRQAPAGAPL